MTLRAFALATAAMMAMTAIGHGAMAQGTRRHVTPGGAGCLRFESVQKSYYIEANWINVCDYEIDITITKTSDYGESTYTRSVRGASEYGGPGKHSEALTAPRERVVSWVEEFY